MAIDRGVTAVFAEAGRGEITVCNASARYPGESFASANSIPPSEQGSWVNYAKAAIQELNRHCAVGNGAGMNIVFDADLPAAAGLSSSSALVVATALAYLRVLGMTLGKEISRVALAELLAQAEQYTGTRGGGMDQAVILLGCENHAIKIDFGPLRVEKVPLIDGYTFVVCDSMERARKSGTEVGVYNAGPRLTALMRAMVEARAKAEFGGEIEIESLADLWYGALCLTHSEIADLFAATFRSARTTLQEASRCIGCNESAIREQWLGDLDEPKDGFPLAARATHLLSEFQRVEAGRDALLAGDAESLGHIMNESHRSCAEALEVSTPALDALAQAARDGGALGARLTGAGFGGCTVSLVPTDRLKVFMRSVESTYYANRPGGGPDTILPVQGSEAAGYLE